MENQNTKSTVSASIGMSEERNEQLTNIVINAIQELGKTEKVNRSNALIACEKELPLDISRTELLYVGYMIQHKAEQFARLQQLEEMEKDPIAMLQMLVDKMKQQMQEDDEDEEESVDPSAN